MSKNIQILSRKIQLAPIAETKEERNEIYKFIRDSQYAQYQCLNRYMSCLASAYYKGGMDYNSEEFQEIYKLSETTDIFNKDINFGTGIGTKTLCKRKVQQDFKASVKNGIGRGERTITNYKRTTPLMTRGNHLKLSYNDNNEIIIKWVNKKSFKAILPKNKNEIELKHTLHKIINGEYEISQSSLEFNHKNKLILNLAIKFPKKESSKVKGRVLGVDLGINIPAYASVSDKTYIREGFGSSEEFLKVRTQMRERKRRLQEQLKNVKGGKGRKKKLKALNSLEGKERRFTNTYNHMISKRIVDFAIKNECESINMENLSGSKFNNIILSNWSYYELQQMIKYKADMNGIKVNFINPAFSSQRCSKCGYIHKENRETQEKFVCKECGESLNADYNASINIAHYSEWEKEQERMLEEIKNKKDKEC